MQGIKDFAILPNGVHKTHEHFKDFEIQTNHLIPARQPDIVVIKKNVHFCFVKIQTANKRLC